MKKILLVGMAVILCLTGLSCQKPAVKAPAVKKPESQTVYYFLPVNQKSVSYKKELVAANSLIVGCQDYLTLRIGTPLVSDSRAAVLKEALRQLLAANPPADDFYHNPLFTNTKISVDDVTQDSSGKLIVTLSGQFTSKGKCEDTVVVGMIQETIRQYANNNYQVILNGSEQNWRCLFNLSGLCK